MKLARVCITAALLSAWGEGAAAQAQPQDFPPFALESADGAYRFQIGALVQFDGRVTDADAATVDTFLVRRARVPLQGRLAGWIDFTLNPDFANNSVNIRDAYVEARFSRAFRVRVGKGKAPFGLERLQSVGTILFVERALPTLLVPDRDTGVQVSGSAGGTGIEYAAALTNGVTDGGSIDADDNDGKDVTGRVVIRPFASRTPRLSELGLAVAASRGEQPADLPRFRTSGQQVFFTYLGDAEGVGHRVRYSPQVFLYSGPFGGFAEYVRSTGDIERDGGGGVRGEVAASAWQVAASWVLTGEDATARGVQPRTAFAPEGGGWGALQIAARYHALRVGGSASALALAAAGTSRTAEAWTVGANWYLTPLLKWMLNVERTVFDEDPDGPRPAEHAVLFRGQLMF